MRRKDRAVKDFDEIIDILSRCKVLHLALISDGKPYSVPVNFGSIVSEENGEKKLSVYFHGAGEGKKLDAIMFHNGYKLPAGVKGIAYNAMSLAKTAVVKIEVSEITGKRHLKK